MIALFEQSLHHLPRRVVGIRHKVERVRDRQGLDQAQHFIEQSALITIGPYQALYHPEAKKYLVQENRVSAIVEAVPA
jgi:hypothetical protein